MLAREKRKHIEGLNPISRKKYLISNLIICFRFPRASVRHYTVRATARQSASTTIPENNFLFSRIFREKTSSLIKRKKTVVEIGLVQTAIHYERNYANIFQKLKTY